MKFEDIIKTEFLNEGRKIEKAGSIKIFYDINMIIQDDGEENLPPPQQEPVAPQVQEVPPEQPVALQQEPVAPQVQEDVNKKTNIITEEAITKKLEGVLSLTKQDVENIQTIDDIMDFLGDKKHKGEDILDDLTVELITTLLGNPEAYKPGDILKKDDQIFLTLLYGYKKDNSIGFKIIKRKGVNSISIVLIKDNEVLDGKFDEKVFNSQVLEFRNDFVNKS